ncbi:hypothetical protein [Xenorhabdus cabanillasii]|uniref:hypothetical protein n=1 Tax=Xenorhabdus cabanillasii TaxID=351673 RepID=UPI001FD36F9B|nr:hypothetical protein [Xenorhabdus cabanillasii]
MAAYNGGIGKLQENGMANMPRETRNYVPLVKQHMIDGAAITENSRNRQEQQFPFPSLYGQKKESEYEEVIAANIAKAVRDAIGNKPFLVEIALVDNKTGERQRFQEKPQGKSQPRCSIHELDNHLSAATKVGKAPLPQTREVSLILASCLIKYRI